MIKPSDQVALQVTLRELLPEQSAIVQRFGDKLNEAARHRLLSLGVYPGATLRFQRFAPLGDPMQLRVDGMQLSVRHEEARHIFVEVIE